MVPHTLFLQGRRPVLTCLSSRSAPQSATLVAAAIFARGSCPCLSLQAASRFLLLYPQKRPLCFSADSPNPQNRCAGSCLRLCACLLIKQFPLSHSSTRGEHSTHHRPPSINAGTASLFSSHGTLPVPCLSKAWELQSSSGSLLFRPFNQLITNTNF